MTNPAARNPKLDMLADLASSLDKGAIEETIQCAGMFWRIRTLVDHERNWVEQFVMTTSPTAMFFSRRAPTLAIAIRAMGTDPGSLTPIEEVFTDAWLAELGGQTEGLKAMALLAGNNPYAKQYFFASKLLEFLSNRPGSFVSELWNGYRPLEVRQDEAGNLMGKSSSVAGS